MQIVVADSETDFYEKAALRIAQEIRKNPAAKIGLSTGRTTKGVHAALAGMYQESPFDCSGVTVFGIDEITNMSRDCRASCYYILLHEVVEPLGIPLENFRMPDPMAKDLEEQCRLFEESVMSDGGPDLIFLGLGENGHLGFNQPGTPFGQRTWLSYMDDSLDERLRRENRIPQDVKMGGLTLGIKNLMQSKKLVMAANGRNKAQIAEKMVSGPVTQQVPASILQLHPSCEVILDPQAAEMLAAE
ncbi:MAG: glucosamine-6-phosphate deaminase [Lachnospiraceae bacterium]|jgi:glucosamine-6-phosphate deaminase|nr:glucosamine-6-phosphate deaminase [Lachnospiraceae bacterium]